MCLNRHRSSKYKLDFVVLKTDPIPTDKKYCTLFWGSVTKLMCKIQTFSLNMVVERTPRGTLSYFFFRCLQRFWSVSDRGEPVKEVFTFVFSNIQDDCTFPLRFCVFFIPRIYQTLVVVFILECFRVLQS